MKRTRLILRALPVAILCLILVQTGAAGQSTAGLVIQILDANEGENLIDKELPPMKVRVMDRTGRVISGASVLFQAPEEGPTGHFLPNSSEIRATTDTQGMATAPRFRTNSRVGEYQIQIVASYRGSVAEEAVPQTNIFKVKSSRKKFIIVSAMIGGAAAAALATKGGSSGPASSALESLAATPAILLGGTVPTISSGDTLVSTPATSGSPATDPAPLPSPCTGPPNSNRPSCR